jgi:transmembrane sensor
MSRRRPQPPPQDLHEVAANWFARQRSGAITDQDRACLREWLQSDPAHAAAYADVRRGWGGAGSVRSDPRVLAMRERWAGVEAPSRYWRAGRALAASLIVALVLAGAFAGWGIWAGPGTLGDHQYRTAVGEQRTIELADGSLVTLNTNTVLRTRRDDERRLLYLDKGQAFFEVAKNPDRPFVVTAAGRTVTALGTAFDVNVAEGEFKVTLVEGKVRVEALVAAQPSPSATTATSAVTEPVVQATEMVAGTQLVAPANEDWRIVRPNLLAETSWTKGRLIFNRQPLAEVVEEINRYSDRKIVIGDSKLADVPISGTFKPGDIASFVAALEDYQMARRGRATDRSVELLPY